MKTFDAAVECLLPGGAGCLTTEQGRVLLHDVAPGDRITASVTQQQRGIAHAKLERIVEASPERCAPPCPVADRCGGCALQVVKPSAHAAIKSGWVRHAFAEVWHPHVHWQSVTPCQEGRRRVRWHLNKQQQLGFYSRASHQVVASPSCMVLTPDLQALLQAWHTVTPALQASDAPQAVYAVALENGIHVVLEYKKKPAQLPIIALNTVAEKAIQWWWHDGQVARPLSRPVLQLYDSVLADEQDIQLNVGPDDFVQGNRSGNRAMLQQTQVWCKGARRVVDLFSGIGNISLPLAILGHTVHGFEMNPASVRAANASAKRLSVPARYEVCDLMGRLATLPEAMIGADVLILDPPRKGAKQLCRQLHRLLPRQIIMIHCDPASAARDSDLVAQQGYRLQAVRGLDLFPFSGHVESMSLWQR
jgi:23S rRNA (uracil1939-C5)-methyltransferase